MIMRIPFYCYSLSLNLLFFFLFLSTASLLLVSSSSCHSKERSALLQFKQLFSINCKAISHPRERCPPISSPIRIDSWIEGTDCCAWDGVRCDAVNGHVVELILDTSCLYGTIPSNSTLFDLLHLEELDLRCNNFNSSQISPSFSRRLRNLTLLDLSYSNFSGQIPSDFYLPNLSYLDLSGNTISGTIPSSLSNFLNLEILDLSSNELSGTIKPDTFGKKLMVLRLSSNKLSGTIELDKFAKLENLTDLDLSNSGLTANYVRSSNTTFQHISFLQLASCNLSDIPFALLTNPKELVILNLNNNNINEKLHPLICNLNNLQYLDLSDNQFYGLLPACLGNFSSTLEVLKLQMNNFYGTIPPTFGRDMETLQVLDISHNGFHGMVPRSLADCLWLEVLNMGHNSIVDVFPFWLGGSKNLQVLVLRHNKFYGQMAPPPRTEWFFSYLHIIDVSHNDFTGTLPEKYIESWHSMMVANEYDSQGQYMQTASHVGKPEFYSMTIMNKGYEMDLVKIFIALVVVDFSSNNFSGKIPVSLGRLKGIHVLNFSRNALTGPIPLSLKNLTNLESLDLSKNKLSGEISQQLTSLTFLIVFDVSQNNLTGLIPRGRQFETFSNASYEGNPGLCGFPLSKNCGNIKVPESPFDFSHESMFKVDGFCWEIVVIGYGCGLVIGLVIGSWIIRKREEWLERIFRIKIHSRANRSKKIK